MSLWMWGGFYGHGLYGYIAEYKGGYEKTSKDQ
jgi:hypothetical protein